MSTGLVLLIVAAVLLVWTIASFNGLVNVRTRVQNAWADIDVQLERRHDLVPNLVEAVRGYMQYESSTLEAVTRARSAAVAAQGASIGDRSQAESALTGAVGNLLALSENYPQLRAVESVLTLQEQLTSTENRIAFARQFYNDEVMKYNQLQGTFPRNIFAPMMGFHSAQMFEAASAKREVQKVSI
jgi:LemA protein